MERCRRLLILLSGSAIALIGILHAQQNSTASEKPALLYDISVIRIHPPGDNKVELSWDGMTFHARNVDLPRLLYYAYGIKRSLMRGLPDWASNERFDIEGKCVDGCTTLNSPSEKDQQVALRQLLSERFGLAAHAETQIGPVYELRVGRGGAHLTSSAVQSGSTGTTASRISGHTSPGGFEMKAVGTSMDEFASYCSLQVDRTVLNRTNLPGRFDINLTWTPDVESRSGQVDVTANDQQPSFIPAVLQQLGIVLLPARGDIPILVIDSVAQPSLE